MESKGYRKQAVMIGLVCAAAALLVAMAGCGGGGGSSATPSPFVGHWVGTWVSDAADTGTANVTVSASGAITGLSHDNGAALDGGVAGTITNAGTTSITTTYTGLPAVPWTGTLTVQGNGHLAGAVTAGGGYVGTCTFDLVKQ